MQHLVYLALLLITAPGLASVPPPPQYFFFELSAQQEVPSTPATDSGGCMGVLDEGAASFSLTCSHNVASATLMHIHEGERGVNGPVVEDLGDPTVIPVAHTWTGMTVDEIADLKGGLLYVNVHADGRPDGAIRGQIVTRTTRFYSFVLDGSQQVPPDVSTAAVGACSAEFSDDGSALTVACWHDVVGATAAHLHNAPAGENGPSTYTFTDPESPSFVGTKVMAPADMAELLGGFYYVNIHSPEGGGEGGGGDPGVIRGQIVNTTLNPGGGFESGDASLWSSTQP